MISNLYDIQSNRFDRSVMTVTKTTFSFTKRQYSAMNPDQM